MPSFGSFQADREIFSDPFYTVYAARKSGDPQSEYAIKLFSLHHIDLDKQNADVLDPLFSDIERSCVERIGVQERAAAASQFVSPILETGQDERGVWYATRFYPR